MIILVVTILALGGGALLFIRSSNDDNGIETLVAASEQSEIHQTIVSEQTSITQTQPEQFVDEQGNHWIKQPDGTMLWWNGTDWQQVDS